MIALIAAVTAGVVLPKALPAALVGRVSGRWARFTDLLPAATLGALAVLTTLGAHDGLHPKALVVVAAVLALVVSAAARLGVRPRWKR